jgi:hypothetical protein
LKTPRLPKIQTRQGVNQLIRYVHYAPVVSKLQWNFDAGSRGNQGKKTGEACKPMMLMEFLAAWGFPVLRAAQWAHEPGYVIPIWFDAAHNNRCC